MNCCIQLLRTVDTTDDFKKDENVIIASCPNAFLHWHCYDDVYFSTLARSSRFKPISKVHPQNVLCVAFPAATNVNAFVNWSGMGLVRAFLLELPTIIKRCLHHFATKWPDQHVLIIKLFQHLLLCNLLACLQQIPDGSTLITAELPMKSSSTATWFKILVAMLFSFKLCYFRKTNELEIWISLKQFLPSLLRTWLNDPTLCLTEFVGICTSLLTPFCGFCIFFLTFFHGKTLLLFKIYKIASRWKWTWPLGRLLCEDRTLVIVISFFDPICVSAELKTAQNVWGQ